MCDNSIPVFKQLSWRFDVQIASRVKQDEFTPKILMKLDLQNQSNSYKNKDKLIEKPFQNNDQQDEQNLHKSVYIESDFKNLKNLQTELQRILKHHESYQYKKTAKTIK